ncbi:hypothetical protein BKI52_29700 [marine bacterium AO1-C]|nr:hypothetical protein BKI52_29700 [marine bacterium AO1-C]
MIKYNILIPAINNQKLAMTSIIHLLIIQQTVMHSYLSKLLFTPSTSWKKPESLLLLEATHQR